MHGSTHVRTTPTPAASTSEKGRRDQRPAHGPAESRADGPRSRPPARLGEARRDPDRATAPVRGHYRRGARQDPRWHLWALLKLRSRVVLRATSGDVLG